MQKRIITIRGITFETQLREVTEPLTDVGEFDGGFEGWGVGAGVVGKGVGWLVGTGGGVTLQSLPK